ncbi:uncharacterized protein JN550_005604 [Neoarthrinium moseri]|uniref:uncharacterized protein n=1 Tax=Neoarthrinium moseri TaxID=1658444 RepID=UPI001FDB4933|nr:uncharacterized protein JN550_005604 [Neoarthrinium moseri]KAI1870014.1 hypothetical protein JN550_005604 [Neoarthrinium moseri]
MVHTTPSGRLIWDEEAHVQLLTAIFKHAPPSDVEWEAIRQDLATKDFHCTVVALKQHLIKLRKRDGNLYSPAASAGSAGSTPVRAPRGGAARRGRGSSGRASGGGRGGRGKRSAAAAFAGTRYNQDYDPEEEIDDYGPGPDVDGDIETPSKRIKRSQTMFEADADVGVGFQTPKPRAKRSETMAEYDVAGNTREWEAKYADELKKGYRPTTNDRTLTARLSKVEGINPYIASGLLDVPLKPGEVLWDRVPLEAQNPDDFEVLGHNPTKEERVGHFYDGLLALLPDYKPPQGHAAYKKGVQQNSVQNQHAPQQKKIKKEPLEQDADEQQVEIDDWDRLDNEENTKDDWPFPNMTPSEWIALTTQGPAYHPGGLNQANDNKNVGDATEDSKDFYTFTRRRNPFEDEKHEDDKNYGFF